MFLRPITYAFAVVALSALPGRNQILAQSPMLYLVCVYDTISPDIRECTMANESLFVGALTDNFPNGAVKYIPLSGRNCSAAQIRATFASLPNVSRTPVVFYYSGHGFSVPGQGTSLHFPVGKRSEKVDDLFQVIERQSPRLFVTVVDCCNVDPPKLASGTAPAVPITRVSPLGRHLFMQHRGVYHFYSSSEGQAAIGFHDRGDFFMGGSPFTQTFAGELANTQAVKSWHDIFRTVKRETALGFQEAYPRGLTVTYNGQRRLQMTQTASLNTHQ